jgi:hypothetical protein
MMSSATPAMLMAFAVRISSVLSSCSPRRGGRYPIAHGSGWNKETALLSYDDYRGSVSRITENVLRRFTETPYGETVAPEI